MDGHAIINPAAGGGRLTTRPGGASKAEASGCHTEPHFTEGPGDATRLARTLWNRFDDS